MAGTTRGIIFDLDGTLLDTIADLATGCNRGLAAFGYPPRTLDEYKRFVGAGIEVLVRRALPGSFRDEARFPEVLDAVAREYASVVVDQTWPYPGIPELLAGLGERGVPMAVLSNKPHDLTRECVRRLLPAVRFAAVFGTRPGKPHKPDPAVPLEMAALLDRAPGDVILVGDSEVDIETAANAGMKAAAVSWGFRPRSELAALHPFALVDRPEEILNLL